MSIFAVSVYSPHIQDCFETSRVKGAVSNYHLEWVTSSLFESVYSIRHFQKVIYFIWIFTFIYIKYFTASSNYLLNIDSNPKSSSWSLPRSLWKPPLVSPQPLLIFVALLCWNFAGFSALSLTQPWNVQVLVLITSANCSKNKQNYYNSNLKWGEGEVPGNCCVKPCKSTGR